MILSEIRQLANGWNFLPSKGIYTTRLNPQPLAHGGSTTDMTKTPLREQTAVIANSWHRAHASMKCVFFVAITTEKSFYDPCQYNTSHVPPVLIVLFGRGNTVSEMRFPYVRSSMKPHMYSKASWRIISGYLVYPRTTSRRRKIPSSMTIIVYRV